MDIYCDREAYPKGNRSGNTDRMHPEVEKYRLLEHRYYTRIRMNTMKSIIWRYCKGIFLLLFNFHKAPGTILNSFNFLKYEKTRYGDLADWFKPLFLMRPLLELGLWTKKILLA